MESSRKKSLILKLVALVIGLVAIQIFISSVSYLFNWKTDASLLSQGEDLLDNASQIKNLGGVSGVKWGYFWMCRSFGLASFAFVYLLVSLFLKMFFSLKINIVKTVALSLSGMILLSALLSYAGSLIGLDTIFGAGLGGYAGTVVSSFLVKLTGIILPALILLCLSFVWCLFASRKFMDRVLDLRPVHSGKEACEKVVDTPKTENLQEDQVDEAGTLENSGKGFYENAGDEPEDSINDANEVAGANDDMQNEDNFTGVESVVEAPDLAAAVKELPRIDIRGELDRFSFPPLELLEDYSDKIHEVSQDEIEENNLKIRSTLNSFKINVDSVSAVKGPTLTLYKVKLASGTTAASVRNREEDIAMSLGVRGVRVVILTDSVGIEVPNSRPSIVPLKALLTKEEYLSASGKMELPIALGITVDQKVKAFDLCSAPHLLVAGATQQGKSVGLNVIITSLLYAKHPSELKFVFIDPKMVEFQEYRKLYKHYLATIPYESQEEENDNIIVGDPRRAELTLKSLALEMDQRYMLMRDARVNKLTEYNEKFRSRHLNPEEGHRYMPYLVVVIDEYADLILAPGMGPESKALSNSITNNILRLAAKGRACGIHIIIATQRPSVNIITGSIKTNFPVKIAFRVASRTDSGIILDSNGAEKLMGRGDLLFSTGIDVVRAQCAMVDMDEIQRITKFVSDQTGYHQCYNIPYYLPEPPSEDEQEAGAGAFDRNKLDPLFEEAARMVVATQKGSTSDLQRQLTVGYARAGRIMDQLCGAKIVGPQINSRPREVLVRDTFELDNLLESLGSSDN